MFFRNPEGTALTAAFLLYREAFGLRRNMEHAVRNVLFSRTGQENRAQPARRAQGDQCLYACTKRNRASAGSDGATKVQRSIDSKIVLY